MINNILTISEFYPLIREALDQSEKGKYLDYTADLGFFWADIGSFERIWRTALSCLLASSYVDSLKTRCLRTSFTAFQVGLPAEARNGRLNDSPKDVTEQINKQIPLEADKLELWGHDLKEALLDIWLSKPIRYV